MFRNLRLTRPLCFIDLETTALDPRSDRVVEVGILKVAPDAEPFRYNRLVNPGRPIPDSASAIHGIVDELVADEPRFPRMAPRLADADLAGFNLKFDLAFLLAEFRRAGVDFGLAGRSIVDVMRIFKTQEPRDLAAAVRFYCDHSHDGAHSALKDALATAAILDAQVARYEGLPHTVAGLHDLLTEVDIGDRFRAEGGRIMFNFGKHVGRPLDEVARFDPSYLRWMLGQDSFFEDAKDVVRRALTRSSPDA